MACKRWTFVAAVYLLARFVSLTKNRRSKLGGTYSTLSRARSNRIPRSAGTTLASDLARPPPPPVRTRPRCGVRSWPHNPVTALLNYDLQKIFLGVTLPIWSGMMFREYSLFKNMRQERNDRLGLQTWLILMFLIDPLHCVKTTENPEDTRME